MCCWKYAPLSLAIANYFPASTSPTPTQRAYELAAHLIDVGYPQRPLRCRSRGWLRRGFFSNLTLSVTVFIFHFPLHFPLILQQLLALLLSISALPFHPPLLLASHLSPQSPLHVPIHPYSSTPHPEPDRTMTLTQHLSSPAALTELLGTLFEPSPELKDDLVPKVLERIKASPPRDYNELVDVCAEVGNAWDWDTKSSFIHCHPMIGEVSGLSAHSAKEQGQGTPKVVLDR